MIERFSKFTKFGEKRRFDRRNENFEKPVNVGEEYDVEITQVGSKGDGIARVKNFVIFIPNTKQGEKCKVKIKEVRAKFAVAEKIGAVTKKEIAEEKVIEEAPKQEKKVEEKPEKEDLGEDIEKNK